MTKLLALQPNDLNKSTWQKLMSAAAIRGDLEIVTRFLDVGEELHASCGWPPTFPRYLDSGLWHAMVQHHERVIELLLQHGAAPVLRDDANFVLYRGVWTHVPVAKLLIQLARQSTVPGSVSVADLLQYAIRDPDSCNPEIIHYFIDHEPDPTALFRSIRDGHGLGYCSDPETVRCLLEYGAGSAALPGEALRGALDIAIMHRRLNVARTLLECDDITPALHEWIAAIDMFDMAVVMGSERLVCEILQSGASVEGWSENEAVCEPPLMRAVKNRQENMVRLLLRHGAKPRSQALIEAIRLGSVPMARMLLDAGADPNCKDKFHLRGLALLVAVGNEDLFRLLIERGAVMPSGDDLTSILKEILSKSGLPELQMLLDRGVSLANQSFSLLQFAMRGTLEMLDFLYNNGFLKETTYPDARYMRHIWALMANPLVILHPHLLGWLLDKGLVDMPCCAADPYSILVGLFQSNADDQQKEKRLMC